MVEEQRQVIIIPDVAQVHPAIGGGRHRHRLPPSAGRPGARPRCRAT